MISAGISGCVAEAASLPLDTIKVRLQNQSPSATSTPYTGVANCLIRMTTEEGPAALWKGLMPGLARQMVFASLRIGLYNPIRDLYANGAKGEDIGLGTRVAAGLTTGAIGISFANPVDLVKVRLQSEGRLPPGVPRRYSSMADAFRQIYRADGIKGFWTAYIPNVARNSTVNAAELAAYDQLKSIAVNRCGMSRDDVKTHLACAIGAGFFATVAGSPFDVVKTRLMSAKVGSDGLKQYNGLFDAFVKISRAEGPFAFYKGFVANFARIGSWNIVMFLTLEQVRRVMGI